MPYQAGYGPWWGATWGLLETFRQNLVEGLVVWEVGVGKFLCGVGGLAMWWLMMWMMEMEVGGPCRFSSCPLERGHNATWCPRGGTPPSGCPGPLRPLPTWAGCPSAENSPKKNAKIRCGVAKFPLIYIGAGVPRWGPQGSGSDGKEPVKVPFSLGSPRR